MRSEHDIPHPPPPGHGGVGGHGQDVGLFLPKCALVPVVTGPVLTILLADKFTLNIGSAVSQPHLCFVKSSFLMWLQALFGCCSIVFECFYRAQFLFELPWVMCHLCSGTIVADT